MGCVLYTSGGRFFFVAICESGVGHIHKVGLVVKPGCKGES